MNIDAHRARVLALRCGAGVYILSLLNGVRYIGKIPLWAVIPAILVNGAILATIIVTLRRTQRPSEDRVKVAPPNTGQTVAGEHRPRNVRSLWIAAVLYFTAILIAIQYATRMPPQFLAPAGILNMAIILTFVVKLRKAYLPPGKLENRERSRG